MKNLMYHLLIGFIFLAVGGLSVVIRRVYAHINGIDFISNAVGTITWAALFTVIFSFLFYRMKRWKTLTLLISLFFCLGIEFLQLTNIPMMMTEKIPALHYLLGSSFDASDLPWYVVGVLISWLILQRTV